MPNLKLLLAVFWATVLLTSPLPAAEVKTAVLRIDRVVGPPISRLDAPPADLGFAGAMLGNEDNRTTGAFTGMDYTVKTQAVAPEEAVAALDGLKAEGIGLIAVIAEGDILKALSDKAGPEVLLFNAGARDDGLRDATAGPMCCTSRRAVRCSATASFSFSCGRNGSVSC